MNYKMIVQIANIDEFIDYLKRNNINELSNETITKIQKEFQFRFNTEIEKVNS